MSVKHELQNIISGKSEVRSGAVIQAITGYLKKLNEQVKWLQTQGETKVEKRSA